MKDKIALFDFCETLADFQTFDPFMEYVLEKEHVGGFLLKNRIFKVNRSDLEDRLDPKFNKNYSFIKSKHNRDFIH